MSFQMSPDPSGIDNNQIVEDYDYLNKYLPQKILIFREDEERRTLYHLSWFLQKWGSTWQSYIWKQPVKHQLIFQLILKFYMTVAHERR